jgi:hypothetical protein
MCVDLGACGIGSDPMEGSDDSAIHVLFRIIRQEV